jgi:superfamily II DNA or RNA helicase
VQLEPMKSMLKAPGVKRLKLKRNELLSSFTFKFNLRRYKEEAVRAMLQPYGLVQVGFNPKP